jgi:hypothetical protein
LFQEPTHTFELRATAIALERMDKI